MIVLLEKQVHLQKDMGSIHTIDGRGQSCELIVKASTRGYIPAASTMDTLNNAEQRNNSELPCNIMMAMYVFCSNPLLRFQHAANV